VTKLEKRVKHLSKDNEQRQRVERLRGVLNWKIFTQYHDRLTQAFKRLRELDGVVADLKEIYRSFVRTRQTATQSYEGYDATLNTLNIKVLEARERIKNAMLAQGHMLESMAVNELDIRRKRIEGDQVKARFALAESYDRAQKKQIDDEFKAAVEESTERARKVAEQAAKELEDAAKEKAGKQEAIREEVKK
ncbi:MAG: hypothetical protein KAT90_04075, partial [Gammaproteobacteria bacterium]|nr:hypothetical protein [Gammaproteobacteria bacterium]